MEALDLRDVAVEVIGDVAFGGAVVLQGVACIVADIAEAAETVIEVAVGLGCLLLGPQASECL